ncbi:hypothetical protein [Chromobacterium alticapitis]|uniref:Lysozyme inhibitor LprI N-terminal domain-containing protein n=1 Tax=Chromobacterium alticapitis TaxID=2073169 RepID=A0A2S5DDR3_9NEIS|nr:hypothetical protein [Chromobacterium alticapitis]POZ61243.1 hypothetical protein C2I19_14605 [Chromobacterium alticapitis]
MFRDDFMRFLLFLSLFLSFPSLAQIQCDQKSWLSTATCESLEVKKLIGEVSAAMSMRNCKGDDAIEMKDLARAWGREQYHCGLEEGEVACVEERLKEELSLYSKIEGCDLSNHAVFFKQVEPFYVLSAHNKLV